MNVRHILPEEGKDLNGLWSSECRIAIINDTSLKLKNCQEEITFV